MALILVRAEEVHLNYKATYLITFFQTCPVFSVGEIIQTELKIKLIFKTGKRRSNAWGDLHLSCFKSYLNK